MSLEWEEIFSTGNKIGEYVSTKRAKVYGGWIIKNNSYMQLPSELFTETMVFVSDPNHEWKI